VLQTIAYLMNKFKDHLHKIYLLPYLSLISEIHISQKYLSLISEIHISQKYLSLLIFRQYTHYVTLTLNSIIKRARYREQDVHCLLDHKISYKILVYLLRLEPSNIVTYGKTDMGHNIIFVNALCGQQNHVFFELHNRQLFIKSKKCLMQPIWYMKEERSLDGIHYYQKEYSIIYQPQITRSSYIIFEVLKLISIRDISQYIIKLYVALLYHNLSDCFNTDNVVIYLDYYPLSEKAIKKIVKQKHEWRVKQISCSSNIKIILPYNCYHYYLLLTFKRGILKIKWSYL